jgi:hypothetical protein
MKARIIAPTARSASIARALAEDVRLRQANRGDVERIVDRRVGGKHGLELRLRLERERRQVEPALGAEIERDAAEGAGVGYDRGAERRWGGPAHEQRYHVEQLVERVDEEYVLLFEHRRHHHVIAGERAGVRQRCRARPLGAAGMEHHDRNPLGAGAPHELEEKPRAPDLLDEKHEEARRVAFERVGEEVLDPRHRLVAGRDRAGDRHALGEECQAQVGRHRAALRDDDGAVRTACARGAERLEGEGDAIGEIGEADAVGPDQHEPAAARGRGDAVLLLASFEPALGEARGEDDRAAGGAADAGFDRVGDSRLRHDQNHGIHPLRKVVDRGHARPAVDLGAVAADEVDLAGKARALEIGEHVVADRAGLGRRADDGDGARPQQAADRKRPLHRSYCTLRPIRFASRLR